MATSRRYRTKVFLYLKDGLHGEVIFDVTGRNPDARLKAECDAVAEVKRLVCDEGYEFLATVYRDPIN